MAHALQQAGCDVPSALYSFSFAPDYPWIWRYARQPEILDYLRACSHRFGIAPHIRFGAEVQAADFMPPPACGRCNWPMAASTSRASW